MQHLDDAGLAAKTDELRKRVADGETVDDVLPEAFAVVPRGRAPPGGHAALRRPAHRRHGAARGDDRRDGHRRGQDAGGHAAGVPQRACRPGACTSSRSTTTWPSATPSGWGPIYQALGLSVGSSSTRPRSPTIRPTSPRDIRLTALRPIERREAYRCDITYGTNNEFGFDYLRDNMRFIAGGAGPARAALRDRGRGGLDPHRRGAHAADHLGAVRTRPPICTTGSTGSSPG